MPVLYFVLRLCERLQDGCSRAPDGVLPGRVEQAGIRREDTFGRRTEIPQHNDNSKHAQEKHHDSSVEP